MPRLPASSPAPEAPIPRYVSEEDEHFSALEFFGRHPVFRLEDFVAAHTARGRSPATSKAILRDHVARGRIFSVLRGLYVSATTTVDPWVLGTKLQPEAVVAYDGALSFYELTGLGHSLTVKAPRRVPYLCHNEVVYRGVITDTLNHVVVEQAGQPVRVTSLEDTLVDLLDRPDLGPPIDTIWDIFLRAGELDVERMTIYATDLDNAVACARLGYLLQKREGKRFAAFDRLKKHLTKHPGYLVPRDDPSSAKRKRSPDLRLDSDWNLFVPRAFSEKLWAHACANFPLPPGPPRRVLRPSV